MSGWTIKDKNDNTFIIPDETFIDINGYLVIYQDETLFFEQFPTVNNKTGPTFFGLNNEDDIIRIYDENGILYQSVHYYNQFPFPLSADAGKLQIEPTATFNGQCHMGANVVEISKNEQQAQAIAK